MTCHDGCRTTSSLMSIDGMELCHLKRGSYICLLSESNGPVRRTNLSIHWGLANLGLLWITTHSESIQPLQSVKLVYQQCSQTRVEFLHNRLSPLNYIMLNCFAIHYSSYLIICLLWDLRQLVATHMLKLCQLKVTCS
jgi:hypothetical protein